MSDFLGEADCASNMNAATIAGKVIKVEPLTGKTLGLSCVVGYQKQWPNGGSQEIPMLEAYNEAIFLISAQVPFGHLGKVPKGTSGRALWESRYRSFRDSRDHGRDKPCAHACEKRSTGPRRVGDAESRLRPPSCLRRYPPTRHALLWAPAL
jgi:hypothetical protein